MEKLLGILESEIPFGGYGRRITPAECARLREQGVACKETYIVVRAAVDTPRLGYLYEPAYTLAARFARVDVLVGGCRLPGKGMERVKGIEPSYAAWEAAVLPLNYTRLRSGF